MPQGYLASLNDAPLSAPESDEVSSALILREHGELVEKLEAAFKTDSGLVKIAAGSEWLLIDVNQGQLNLAEAVLDMSGGEPLPTSALMKDIELPAGRTQNWLNFDCALQDDDRLMRWYSYVLWCLRRLERIMREFRLAGLC